MTNSKTKRGHSPRPGGRAARVCFTVALALVGSKSSARVEISPWSGASPPPIFHAFPFRYRVAFELEIPSRSLPLVVNDLDQGAIERAIEGTSLHEYAADYLNSQTLADLEAKDPALGERLTADLDLDENAVRSHILANIEAERAQRLAKFHAILDADPLVTLEAPSIATATPKESPNLRARLAAEEAERLEKFRAGLRAPIQAVPKIQDLGTEPTEYVSDWSVLNRRFDALDSATREEHVRFSGLSARGQAEVVEHVLRVGKDLGELVDVTGPGAHPTLQALECAADGTGAVEFRPRMPFESATVMLQYLFDLGQRSNTLVWIVAPTESSRRDSSYHLNFGVDDRPESLEPVLWAWQNLIVMKQLEAGILNLFDVAQIHWNWNLNEKGMVRLREPGRVEIRDHFTNPEEELRLFMEAAALTNAEAVRRIYSEYMPRITPAMIRYVFHASSTAFIEIFFNSPGLRVTLPKDLLGPEDRERVAHELFQSAGYDARILRDPGVITEFLGPEGTELLKAHLNEYLSGPNAETPENEIILREFLAFEPLALSCEKLFLRRRGPSTSLDRPAPRGVTK